MAEPTAARWTFDTTARRYRDGETGRFLSASSARALRDDFLDRRQEAMRTLAGRLVAHDLTVQDWTAQMRTEVKQVWGVQFAYGRGGVDAMTVADVTQLGDLVREQYSHLQGFAEDVAAGNLTAAQVEARAELYAAGSVQAEARGRAAAWGEDLPVYPGEGTECGARCRCTWDTFEDEQGLVATWVLDAAARHCADCLSRADEYSGWRPGDG